MASAAEVATAPVELAKRRPAETVGGISMAVAMLLGRKVFHWDDPDDIAYLAIVVGFVPAGVTWVVSLLRGA